MSKARISVVLNTLNEERNVEYCLRSVRPWCDEIVVVDMMSDDRTPVIARRYADVFLEHERVGLVEPARAVGFGAATGNWILSIDADEVVPRPLAAWITRFVASDDAHDVVLIPRANVFLGRWLRSTPWWPGRPRLFRAGSMATASSIHHGFVPAAGSRIARIPRNPDLSMWHFSHPSIESLVDKTNRYTSIEARQLVAAGRADPTARELIWEPLRAAIVYARRGGPRDGMAGLVFAADRAYYRFMAAAKRWDEARVGDRQREYDLMREQILAGFAEGAVPAATRAIADASADPAAGHEAE